jgi:undecaprenyl-diphosphatase
MRTKAGQRLADRHRSHADWVGNHGALIATLAIGGGLAATAPFGASLIYDGVTSETVSGPSTGPLALGKTPDT